MSKNLTIVLIIIFLVGIGIYAFSNKDDVVMEKNDDSVMMEGDAMMNDGNMEENDSMMEGDGEMMMKTGSYESYSPEKLALANNGKVVLFFRASWCPTCKALDANIKSSLNNIPEGVTILDVDYDNSTELKEKYGVTYQHTLVQVDAQGNMISKWSGSPTLSSLVSEIK